MSLRINAEASSFTAETTAGVFNLPEWIGRSRLVRGQAVAERIRAPARSARCRCPA